MSIFVRALPIAMALLLLTISGRALASGATFVVNSTGDTSDALAGNGVCDDGTGVCTLRAAIQEANALAGRDDIHFAIGTGPQTITLWGAQLPTITESIAIDGTTQPGFSGAPLVRLLGGETKTALDLATSDSQIRSLTIVQFSIGIAVTAGSGNHIEGSYIGTDGSTSMENDFGVLLKNTSNNTIGGSLPSQRNVISGNSFNGIRFDTGASANVVEGNFVGTNALGTLAVPNGSGSTPAISIQGTGNVIGGTDGVTPGGSCTGACNLISGNGGSSGGVAVFSGQHRIIGNFIGTDVSGQFAIGNGYMGGIEIETYAGPTLVGGTTPQERNVMSGNDKAMMILSGGHKVIGNFIGTDSTGLLPLPNTHYGLFVYIGGSQIGGIGPGETNRVAYNALAIYINQAGNSIRGNSIYANDGSPIVASVFEAIFPPTITSGSPLSGIACAGCTVDVYSDDAEEARIYEGSTTADPAGQWAYYGSVQGPNVTATSTDAGGTTTVLSLPFACGPDSDSDGLLSCSDNCPSAANADQLNTDWALSLAGASIAADNLGDACDADDDNDGFSDTVEAHIGTNPLDNCTSSPGSGGDAWPLDVNGNGVANVLDILAYKMLVPGAVDATHPKRLDNNDDDTLNVLDVLAFKNKTPSICH